MIIYVSLHIIFGAIAGVCFRLLKSVGHSHKLKAYLIYFTCMVLLLGIAALIGESSLWSSIAEWTRWLGAACILLSFVVTIFLGRYLSRP